MTGQPDISNFVTFLLLGLAALMVIAAVAVWYYA